MTETPLRGGFAIGVDIGGTKVAAGLVDSGGEIRCQTRAPMVATGAAAAGPGRRHIRDPVCCGPICSGKQ